MRRRYLLSLLAAGASTVTGCSTLEDGTDVETVTPATVPTVSASRGSRSLGERSRSGDGLDTGAARTSDVVRSPELDRTFAASVQLPRSTDQFVPTVSVRFMAAATARSPTLLTGTVRNDTGTVRVVDPSELPLFAAVPQSAPAAGPSEGTLVLVPSPRHEMARRIPRIERTPGGRWRLAAPPYGPLVRTRPFRLDPDESVRFEYRLVGRADRTGFPDGHYRFGRGEIRASVATWRTSRPGPAESSTLADPDPPPFGLGSVTWYHDAGPETAMFLRPSVERASLPVTVTYRLRNRARAIAGTRWLFAKRVDGEWIELVPDEPARYRGLLRLGESEAWTLSLRHGSASGASTLDWLGGGRYAFVVDVGYSELVHAALLDVEAPTLTVTPRDDLTVVRADHKVTVTHPTWSHTPGVDEGVAVLTRSGEAVRRYVPEQAVRDPVVRNTLPFLKEGVETVVFRADRSAVDGLGDGAGRTFSFRGQAYRIGIRAES